MTSDKVSHAGSIFDPTLLSRCISCGFCLPACPTYALTADEASSPRGRINLMRALDSGTLPPGDPTLAEQASFCLGCRACEPVCPAGVQYGELLEQWRGFQWTGRRRPMAARFLIFAAERAWAHRLAGLRRAAHAPAASSQHSLMLGCFERTLFPEVSRSALALAPELAVPGNQGCCGALHAHNGEPARGRQLARQLGTQLPGQIVTTSGGCAAYLSSVLGRDRVVELSEYLQNRVTGQVRIGDRRAGLPCRIPAICATALTCGANRGRYSAQWPSTSSWPALPGAAERPAPTRWYGRATPGGYSIPRSMRSKQPGSITWWQSIPAACVSSARDYAAGNQPSEHCTSPISCAWLPLTNH